MRFGLQTWGSDGDIRPMIALAGGLRAAGHEVILAVASVDEKDYRPEGRALDVTLWQVPSRMGARLADLLAEVEGKSSITALQALLRDFFFPHVETMHEAACDLAGQCDVVVGHFLMYPTRAAALKARKPFATVTYWPGMIPTLEEPVDGFPNWSRWTNWLTWRFLQFLLDRLTRRGVNELHDREGLPRCRHAWPDIWFSERLNLVAASPTLCSRPRDWDARHELCGYLRMPSRAEDAPLPEGLERFLSEGEPPVYLGLGSTQQVDPERGTDLLLDAARQVGCRAVVKTTSSRFPADTSDGRLYFFGRGPHARLFPRCSLIVHHGGAGTTHTASLAGRPSVVVAFIDEQFAWGRSLARLGAAAKPLRYPRATPAILAQRIEETLASPGRRSRAEELAAAMTREDGVARAVALLEGLGRDAGPTSRSGRHLR